MSPEDGLPLDIARRLADGEDVDVHADGDRLDPELARGVEKLRKLIRPEAQTTEEATTPPPKLPPPPPPPPPRRSREESFIGDFRLVRKLGEGGMGVVYEAEQQHPHRPVALKVIRGGAHVSSETLKLFQREAQTLARLRHPGISALYETGATDEGLHFFAMELVRGDTLGDWLKKRPAGPVSPQELKLRLGVFKKICDAVAYAHQRGVIHRDLKPANVLIPKTSSTSSMQDPVPDVKVLDFGLARMTETDVQMTTYHTEMGKVRGTLPYMSPEQVRGNPDEIDLRSDVYSLGVILYEMVTGKLPIDISRAQLPEAVRIICEEPPRSLTSTFTGTKRLDADVVTIAGKALEKEPSRRYQSAAALGDDIQHWLDDEPILARRPSPAYQFRKLVLRHKGPFAAVAGVFVLLAVFAASMTFQAIRISKERDRANQEAETAKRVSHFLEGLFKVPDPSESRGNTVEAREILDKGAEQIGRELRDQPKVQARLVSTIARTYMGLGLVGRANSMLLEALEKNRSAFGADSVEYADALSDVAGAEGGARGLQLATEAQAIRERLLPSDDLRVLKGLWQLGVLQMVQGDAAAATPILESGLHRLEKTRSPDDRLRIWFLNDLSNVYAMQGKLDDALRSVQEALRYRELVYPRDHPERAAGLNQAGYIRLVRGERAAARPLLEESLRLSTEIYGPEHVNLTNALHSLAELNRQDGRLDEAKAGFQRALSILENAGAGESVGVLGDLTGLGQVDEALGEYRHAEDAYRRAIAIATATAGPDSERSLEAVQGLARIVRRNGNELEADSLDEQARSLEKTRASTGQYVMGTNVPTTRIEGSGK